MILHLNPLTTTNNFYNPMILIGFLLISSHTFSQSNVPPSLPQVTTPSPEATMMNRYGNYPVSLYTGLVDITIPIFEINISGIKVPVEFKYHASGLRYDDLPMELGYGWTLMAGGTISHSFRGTPEGRSFSMSGQRANPYAWVKDIKDIQKPLQTGPGTNDNDQNRLIYITNGVKYPYGSNTDYYSDSEYDEWDYNFLNHTGQSYRMEGNIINVPSNGFTVCYTESTITAFDNDGISYTFNEMDYDGWGLNEVWYLTKIVSANKADTISFDYTVYSQIPGNSILKPVIDQRVEVTTINQNSEAKLIGPTGNSLSYKPFFPPQLNDIKYRGGKIEFIYTSNTSRNLSEIRIYDNRNILYRTVELKKPRTNWLDGIEFRDNAGAVQEAYDFEYNGTPNTDSGIDYWGYYNGATIGTFGYIPNFTISFPQPGAVPYSYTIPGTDRTPNFDYMAKGMLTKIIYPTKGYTVFEYEANRSNNQIYGGLRIKEIRNYNHDNTLVERKWYKYGSGESGNGRDVFPESYAYPSLYFLYFYRESTALEIDLALTITNRSYFKDIYPFPLTNYFSSGSPVVYPEVTEYSGTGSVANGRTVYKYTDTPDEYSFSFRGLCQPQKYESYQWRNGLLISKEVYNSSNQMIYSLANSYSSLFTSESLNLGVVQYADLSVSSLSPPPAEETEFIKNNLNAESTNISKISDELKGTLFDYYNYYISTGMPVLGSTVEYQDGVTTTTIYSDYKSFGLPAQMQVTNSEGDNIITKYKYPEDFTTIAPYNLMYANEIYTPIIQQEQYKGTVFLSKTVNEYKDWGNNRFEPEFLKFQPTAGSALETRITYYNRDSKGNPLYISKDDADKVVYLWSYNYLYPVAEIKNATLAEVNAVMNTVFGVADAEALAALATPNETKLKDGSLQNALPNALVTTYTYKPLVGILTMTDPRGAITYYEYDSFNRLKTVKDNKSQSVEGYDYHYKN